MMNHLKEVYKALTWDKFEAKESRIARERIKNKDFTIIASNCYGGVIYHHLGMRFDSPTINLWINNKEFCRFVAELPYYLSQKLRFYIKEGRVHTWGGI